MQIIIPACVAGTKAKKPAAGKKSSKAVAQNAQGAQPWSADCLILPCFEDGKPLSSAAASIASVTSGAPWLAASPALGDFKGAKGERLFAYAPEPGADMPRVLLCGLGKPVDFQAAFLRDAVACAVQACAGLKLARLALPLETLELIGASAGKPGKSGNTDSESAVWAACGKKRPARSAGFPNMVEESVLGALLGLYSCDIYRGKSAAEDKKFKPESLALVPGPHTDLRAAEAFARKSEALANGIYFARDLINGPGNVVTPSHLEGKAQELARGYGFYCASLGPDYLRDEGFGAFLSVAKGSAQEPRLIILEHRPYPENESATDSADGGAKSAPAEGPVIIVGKGVTFDSGGISLKPSAKMHEMKSDMAGAGAVFGLFAAMGECLAWQKSAGKNPIPELERLAGRHVIGIIPCANNMPDGNATHPGDVVTTLSGKTVEITNTDAEGRLLLCDCLTLAQRRWKPAALIDVATLTGACVVALGENTTGLFANNLRLRDKILELGERCSERFWPLPVYDEDLDDLKSNTADLNNVGPREGGALYAALFLKQFIEPGTPWAHLDIAGSAYSGKKTPINPGGASGVGLRTLFELVSGS